MLALPGSSFTHAQDHHDTFLQTTEDTLVQPSLPQKDSGHALVELIEAPAKLQQLREVAEKNEKDEKRRNKVRIAVVIAAVAIIIILLIRKRRRSN